MSRRARRSRWRRVESNRQALLVLSHLRRSKTFAGLAVVTERRSRSIEPQTCGRPRARGD
ncbi:MAG: hypothetical protein ACRDOO_22195 [Actinomadura sp.]